MIQKKFLLAAAGLVAASAPLFAAHTGSSSAAETAVKTTSQANVQAEGSDTTESPVVGSVQNRPPLASTPRNASIYAGVGMAMLNDKGFTGLMPKLMAGYGVFFKDNRNVYGALEVGAGAGTILLSTNNQKFRVSRFVNVSIIPGYMIYEQVMLYARLGIQATHYSKLNSTKHGGVYGIGLELNNSQHWDTRFEYNYADNKNLNQYIVDLIYKFK